MSSVDSANALTARLKLRHLRLVLALSEYKISAKVAQQLHISPAAVSKTLAEIEEIIGVKLFDRGRRGMLPNEVGREVIQVATLVCGQLARMSEYVQAARQGKRGRLTIAFRTLSVQPFLAQTVCAFHEIHPLVDISVIEGAVGDLIAQLVNGELDILFAYEDPRFDLPELISTPVVGAQNVVVIASLAHPLLRQKKITAKDLVDQQWCLPAFGTRHLHHLDTAFQMHDLPSPSRGIRTSDIAMTISLLQNANFLAVLPMRIAAQLVSSNVARLLPFSPGTHVEPVVALRNGALKPRSAAKTFLEFCMRRAAETAILTSPEPK